MISVKDLTKDYGNNKGVFNVSLEIQKGEVFRISWTKWSRKNNNDKKPYGIYKTR